MNLFGEASEDHVLLPPEVAVKLIDPRLKCRGMAMTFGGGGVLAFKRFGILRFFRHVRIFPRYPTLRYARKATRKVQEHLASR